MDFDEAVLRRIEHGLTLDEHRINLGGENMRYVIKV
jgi:hypothetical protein